jgi:hypothetical protein
MTIEDTQAAKNTSVRARLDQLIDWYEQMHPGRRHTIQVHLARCTAEKFCTKYDDGLEYRGHTIVPIHKTEHCGGRKQAIRS